MQDATGINDQRDLPVQQKVRIDEEKPGHEGQNERERQWRPEGDGDRLYEPQRHNDKDVIVGLSGRHFGKQMQK